MHPGTTLTDAMRNWPTPGAGIHNEGESPETFAARRERLKEKHNNGNGMGVPLGQAAMQWATPKGTGGGNVSRGNERSGELLLAGQAQKWNTPRSVDWKGHETAPGKAGSFMLGRQAFMHGRPDQETATDGSEQSSPARLSPSFVEWLMGFPIGWTVFEPLGTEWSRWQLRMRSELSRLGWE